MCPGHPVISWLVGCLFNPGSQAKQKKPGLTLACEIIFRSIVLSWNKADHLSGSDQTSGAGGISLYTDIIQTKLTG